MKKIILLLFGAMMVSAISAQVLKEDESALVYYSPKATIALEFSYTVEQFERGQYAEFAEAMLGTTDAVKETGSVCTLKDVRIGTAITTDYNRPHKVVNNGVLPLLLSINDKGLLTGYNVPAAVQKQKPRKEHECKKHEHECLPLHVAPYPEDVLKAANPQAQALEIAKQIFHLRETRMYLLNGEVEHAPADGEAMKLVLEELDKQERALTELFIGRKHLRHEQKTVLIEPSNEGELLFFSDENGFTDSDNVDADTIEVRMLCQQQEAQPLDPKAKKKAQDLTQIVYNVPGYCAVNVLYKGKSLANSKIPVAQLGIDVALPTKMFTGKALPKITFSEKTGNIVSISQ